MKKQAINFSWPATLSDFSTDTANENFSRGKLKVFYKGETADHRFFSDSFSEELINSLPYTPVVSYYDEEKDDFVGHATEQQILGIVDPCREPSFEEDADGTSWCVCDVVLYTERPDKVGDLAKKIVGHSQSLELDPSSVKYTINYDEKKHFKNIEFTAGRFVGVSVLGDDQQPAFTGSSFFSYDEQFENKMKTLREYCETKRDQTQSGGNTMNLQEFMKLSWGDISSKVADAIATEYAEEAFTYVVDMFEDSAIVQFYSFIEDKLTLQRIKYSVGEDGAVTLGDVNEVHITYEDVIVPKTTMSEETGVTQTTEAESEPSNEDPATKMEENVEVVEETIAVEDSVENCAKKDEEKKDEDPKDESSDDEEPKDEESDDEESEDEESDDEESEDDKSDEDDKKKKDKEEFVDAACEENGGDATPVEEEAAQVVNAEVTETEKKVSVDNEQEQQEVSSGSTSFTESERAELEALKREKKVTLVDSYKDSLSEEEYNSFIEKIDSFSAEGLELELLKAYKRAQETQDSSAKPIRAFSFSPVNEHKTESPLDSFVRKNMR